MAAVREVQVSPSGLVITRSVPLEATATNNGLLPTPTVPYVTERQSTYVVNGVETPEVVQVVPLVLIITLTAPVLFTETNRPLP